MEIETYGRCTILAGIPGAGKDHYIRNFLMHEDPIVMSTDDFWTKGGEYNFDPARITEAHNWNMRRFVSNVTNHHDHLLDRASEGATDAELERHIHRHFVVNNTNTTFAEIAPYYQVAQAYGLDVTLVFVLANPEDAIARQVHGVPAVRVVQMDLRLKETMRNIPPWWRAEVRFG